MRAQLLENGGGVLGAGAAARKWGGGLRCGSNSKTGGVLGAGHVKKGGLYRGTYLYWTYM